MNTYYLNDTPLAAFGFVPGHASGSNIALSGAWDMPARTGDSYRQWDGEDGVEPYVSTDDRFAFDSREIQLTGHLVADDEAALRENTERFRRFLAALPATSQLRCDWGQWSVGLRKEVKINPRRNIASVTLTFTEVSPELPDFSGQTPEWPGQWILASGHWNTLGIWDDSAAWYCDPRQGAIDEWLWDSLGLVVASTEGAWDLPARREIKANQFPAPDRWAPGGLDTHTLSLRATLRAADMDDLARKARSLCWLFGQPGLRRLRYKERLYSMFATEGFQVTDIQKRSLVYAKFTVKLIEAHE